MVKYGSNPHHQECDSTQIFKEEPLECKKPHLSHQLTDEKLSENFPELKQQIWVKSNLTDLNSSVKSPESEDVMYTEPLRNIHRRRNKIKAEENNSYSDDYQKALISTSLHGLERTAGVARLQAGKHLAVDILDRKESAEDLLNHSCKEFAHNPLSAPALTLARLHFLSLLYPNLSLPSCSVQSSLLTSPTTANASVLHSFPRPPLLPSPPFMSTLGNVANNLYLIISNISHSF